MTHAFSSNTPHPPPVHVSSGLIFTLELPPVKPGRTSVCHQRHLIFAGSFGQIISVDIRPKAKFPVDPRPDIICQIYAHRISTLHCKRTISPVVKGTDSRGKGQGFEPA